MPSGSDHPAEAAAAAASAGGGLQRRSLPVIAAAATLALWLGVAWWIDAVYADYRLGRLRAEAATAGASAAGNLANVLNQRLALVRGLAAFVSTKLDDPNDLAVEFPVFAAAVHGAVEGIRNISVCPDFIVRHVYPTDPGNLKVLGNDILADKRPGFAEAVRRAVDHRGMAVHEPVTLIQGGMGLIARHAIHRGEAVWGAVGMVFSIEPMLAGFGDGLDRYRWAVRSAGGAVVGGDASVFAADPVTARAMMPEGYWEVGLVPVGGWANPVFQGIEPAIVRFGLAVAGVILTLAVWDALRRRARLEALVEERTRSLSGANAELARLAYVTAHDLQEPLRTIASYSQLVERHSAGELGEQSREWLDRVIAAARRMKDLLADIQIYLAEQELPLPAAAVPAGDCLAAVLRALGEPIAACGARVEAEPLPPVLADRHRLTDVLTALLSNAIEYRDAERGLVIRLRGRVEGRMAAIEVEDNGIGIDPAYHDRIFQVFQRLHDRADHPGTGMGLAIARKMVERLGGSLTVRSTPGVGSVFTIRLPTGEDRNHD